MKSSISFREKEIVGWVSDPKSVNSVELIMKGEVIAKSFVDQRRKDVVAVGFSSEEICGFLFDCDIDIDLEDGNFLCLKINCDKNFFEKYFFIGDFNLWGKNFDNFQVEDRRDFSIQANNINSLFVENKDLIALKILLIRLRRGKRAFAWRGSFSGNVYDEMSNDWLFFRNFFITHFSILKDILSVRSLWSIVDTFADFGSDLERACALSISNYLFQERCAQTWNNIYLFKIRDNVISNNQYPYWGGMLSNRLESDDSYDIFLTRIIEVLDCCPVLKKTFGVIFLKALESDVSIIGLDKKYSPYFANAFNFYKSYFLNFINDY